MKIRRLKPFFAALIAAVLLVPAADALPKTIDWSKARKVQRGVLMVKMNLDRPRLLKVAVMRVDLHTPGLTLTTTARDARWGKEMPDRPGILIGTKRITTAQFLLDARKSNGRNPGVNMIAAFNAAPWTPWESPFKHKYGMPLGLNISNGVVVSDNHPELPAMVEWKHGGIELLPTVDRKLIPKIKEAA